NQRQIGPNLIDWSTSDHGGWPMSANLVRRLLAETVGTFLLVGLGAGAFLAATASGAGSVLLLVALGHALGLAAAIYTFGPISGASLNFARTFGPELVTALGGGTTHWSQILVYLIAPPVGALVAAFGYDYIARPRAVRAVPAEAIVTEQ